PRRERRAAGSGLDQRLRADEDARRPARPARDRGGGPLLGGLSRGDLRPGRDDRGEHRRPPRARPGQEEAAGARRPRLPALELRLRRGRRARHRGRARARRPGLALRAGRRERDARHVLRPGRGADRSAGAEAALPRLARLLLRGARQALGPGDEHGARSHPRPGRDLPPRLGLQLGRRGARPRLSAHSAARGARRDRRMAQVERAVAALPRMRALPKGELPRKVVHIGSGLIALALRPLGPLWSAVMGAVAIAFNLLLLPRVGGHKLLREGERGKSIGILLYPVSVFLLILVFHRRLEVAAAGWGLLAFGDGMASVVGLTLGGPRLPWNPRKSWAGSLAYVLFGGAAATVFVQWTAPGAYALGFAAACCFAAALVAAALESQPQGLDDNLGVPMVASLFLAGLLLTQGRWGELLAGGFWIRIAIGFAINAALAALAYAARSVDLSGV